MHAKDMQLRSSRDESLKRPLTISSTLSLTRLLPVAQFTKARAVIRVLMDSSFDLFEHTCMDVSAPYKSSAAVWFDVPDGLNNHPSYEAHVSPLIFGYLAAGNLAFEYLIGIVQAVHNPHNNFLVGFGSPLQSLKPPMVTGYSHAYFSPVQSVWANGPIDWMC